MYIIITHNIHGCRSEFNIHSTVSYTSTVLQGGEKDRERKKRRR